MIWFIGDPPGPASSDIGDNIRLYCSSSNSRFQDGIVWTLFCLNFLVFLSGIYLAFKTRKVDSEFNESHHIGIATYLILVVGLVVIPLISIPTATSYSAVFTIRSLGIILASAFTIFILFLPKIFFMLLPSFGQKTPKEQSKKRSGKTSESSNKGTSEKKNRTEENKSFIQENQENEEIKESNE